MPAAATEPKSGEDAEPARPAVPLTFRVGFVGHRRIDEQAVAPLIAESFRLLAGAVQRMADWPTGQGAAESLRQALAVLGSGDASPRLALFSGFAPGADRLAAATWLRLRSADPTIGPSHGLLPFVDPERPHEIAWTDRPGNEDGETRIDLRSLSPDVFDSVTVLDGLASGAEFPARDPHLEHGRWIVRWSDALVAAWNGLPAAGPGGTADTVMLALRRGLPILWIDTAAPTPVLRWLMPDAFWADASVNEIVACLADPRQRERLAPRAPFADPAADLVAAFLPPDAEADRRARIDYSVTDSHGLMPLRKRTSPVARCRAALNRSLCTCIGQGWRQFMRALAPAPPEAGAAPPPVPRLLALHCDRADEAATFSGDLHRGTQAAFLVAAVASVILGTLPAAVANSADLAHALKHWTVPAEALLLSLVIVVWNLHYFATNHRRWSDCRRLAERLRCLRATWPLGFDVADGKADRPRTWTEWQARAIRRASGPPVGVMLATRMLSDVAGSRADPRGIVAGQAAYNALTSERLHVLHGWLVSVEKCAFGFLLGFLGLYTIGDWSGWHDIHAIAGPLVVASAVIPTLCAACLALDAKLGIEENYVRTKQLAREFAALDVRMVSATTVAEGTELMRDASRLLLKDVDGWQDAAVRRKIAAL